MSWLRGRKRVEPGRSRALLSMDDAENRLLGAKRMAVGETSAVAKNLRVDGFANHGSGAATAGGTEETPEDGASDTSERSAYAAGYGAD